MHRGVVVLSIDDGAQPWLYYPLELSDGNVLLAFVSCGVASPCRAVACTIYVGAVLWIHDEGVAVVVEGSVASVLVDAMDLSTCWQK